MSVDEFSEALLRFADKQWDAIPQDMVSTGHANLLFLPPNGRAYYCGTFLLHGIREMQRDSTESGVYWDGYDLCSYSLLWAVQLGASQFTAQQDEALRAITECLALRSEECAELCEELRGWNG